MTNSNIQTADFFGVSEGTVRNYVTKIANSEVDLDYYYENDKIIIEKTAKNIEFFKKISKKVKSQTNDVARVKNDLYTEFVPNDILKIVSNLQNDSPEIPLKFAYMNDGAANYSKYLNNVDRYAFNLNNIEIIDRIYPIINAEYDKNAKINIVDLGTGNGTATIPLLAKLKSEGRLGQYFGLDISQKLLDITKKNLEKENLPVTTFCCDFYQSELEQVLYKIKSISKNPCLVLLINGTLSNYDNQELILKNIKNGMLGEDRLLISDGFDSNDMRNQFTAFENPDYKKMVLRIPNLLGLDSTNSKIVKSYCPKFGGRKIDLIMTKTITLKFRDVNIKLNKNTKINIWKHRADNFEHIFKKTDQTDFKISFVYKLPNRDYIMYLLKTSYFNS